VQVILAPLNGCTDKSRFTRVVALEPKSPPEEALSVCSVVGFLNSVQSAAIATIVRAAVFRPVDLNTLGLLRLVRDKFELSKPTEDRESSGDAVTRDDKLRD